MAEMLGKTAIVTGAAHRLGRGIALALADVGVNIVVHYRNSDSDAESLRREIEEKGVQCWKIQADLKDEKTCIGVIDDAFGDAKKVDFLINNASVYESKDIMSAALEDLEKNFVVNAWAPFFLSRRFAAKNPSGKIINMIDAHIDGYDFERFPYHSSKEALERITRSLALKFAPGMTVNAVSPGLILPLEGKDYSSIKSKEKEVPLKRHGEPENVADAVLFLLNSDFITGQTIYVDGGAHLVHMVRGGNT